MSNENPMEHSHELVRKLTLATGDKKVIEFDNGYDRPVHMVVIPNDCRLETFIEKGERPQRIEKDMTVSSVESFIEYVNEFKQAGTIITGHPMETREPFIAIIDYHEAPNTPSHCTHRLFMHPNPSNGWLTWTKNNCQWMRQRDFVEFIEDNIEDIVEDGTVALQGAKSVRTTTAANTRANVSDTGDDAEHSVENQIISSLPAKITVQLAVLDNTRPFNVEARIRTRSEGTKVELRYELIGLDRIKRTLFRTMLELVQDKTKMRVLV